MTNYMYVNDLHNLTYEIMTKSTVLLKFVIQLLVRYAGIMCIAIFAMHSMPILTNSNMTYSHAVLFFIVSSMSVILSVSWHRFVTRYFNTHCIL